MNEPNNDKLMKIMIRLKGCVGNIEPIVKRDNGNGGPKNGNSSKKNWPRANQATGVAARSHLRVSTAVRSTP